MKISAVIPVYGAPNSLKTLHERLIAVFQKVSADYEIILVNDACPKNSWAEIQSICRKDPKAKGVNLVRNFGQHSAISAGLAQVTGDWVTVLDCDLQDDPAHILEFLRTVESGKFDVVLAHRVERQERLLKRIQSWLFYKFLNIFLGVKMDHRVGNYGFYSRRVIDATKLMGDKIRFFPFLISWLQFPTTSINIVQNGREEGQSSYTLRKALGLALDVALASSNRPLLWSVQLGGICALSSFAFGTFFLIRYFSLGLAPTGWTSLIVTIFFSTGLILVSLGILGLYISRMNDQVRSRPNYIIQEIIN